MKIFPSNRYHAKEATEMKAKRITALLLTAVMILPTLFACGPQKTPVTIDAGSGYELPATLVGSAPTGTGLPDELCSVSVTARDGVGRTVPTNTAFTLSFEKPTDTATVSEYLSVYPETEIKIDRLSDTEYTVTPEKELDSGTVYRLLLGSDGKAQISFAFQTESAFALSSSIPADLATNVPTNTGIEFEFTSQIKGGTDISKYVSVEPEFEYKAELYPNGRRLVLIPQKKLDKNTEYTVTLKKGLPSASGEVLSEDITIRFRTEANYSSQDERKYYFSASPAAIVAKTGDNAVYAFSFYARNGVNAEIKDVKAEIFKYRSHSAMLDAVKEFNEKGAALVASGEAYEYTANGLTKVSSGSVKYEASGTRRYYAHLPKLESGAYLVNITVTVKYNGKNVEETVQALLQVSELAAYFESSEDELIIWGTKNGTPVKNISVSAEFFERHTDFSLKNDKANYTKITAKTDKDGIARIEIPEEKNAAICLLEKDGENLLLFPGALDERVSEPVYGYIFTDRQVYFGDDKINFDGAIIPVNGEIPEKLWLQVNYRGAKYPVTVNPDGSFEGSYVLEGYSGYSITLRLIDESGKVLLSKYVRVTEEDKPVYTASISFDKLFYVSSDTANITVTASFFDGTPASGLKFRIFANVPGSRKTFDVTTGKDGTATVSYRLPSPDVSSTYPTYVSASAELMGTETAYLYTSDSAVYIHSKYYFTAETASDNGTSYSKILLNRVDTSGIKSAADLSYSVFPQNTVGKPMEGDAKVSLIKVTYVRRSLGTEYDPINKVTRENYTYDRYEETVKNEVRVFNDGVIRLDHIKENDSFNGYHYYTVTYGKYTLSVNASSRDMSYYDSVYSGLVLESDKEYYSIGDIMKFAVTEYPAATDTARKYLVTVYYGNICEHFVTDSPKLEIPYKAEMIPGACVNVTVLENGGFTQLRSTPRYDYTSNNNLKVEIIPDKTEYKPGDEVNVTVRVTDKNGAPATAGTRVTLSVVDEACFALGDQNLDILSDLFGTFTAPHNNRNESFSLFFAYNMNYYYYNSDGMLKAEVAEDAAATEAPSASGNGGAEEVRVRKYFADNPVFEAKLSENGTAVFTFTAPDNITEWRLTAGAAYTADKSPESFLAGTSVTSVISTLPFFINAGYLDSYIEGDDITCSARVYGKDVSGSFETVAAVYGEDGKLIKSLTAKANAGDFSYFSFGKLDIGEYVLRITCTAKGAGDAVEYPFSVVKTAVLATTEKLIEVSDIHTITPAKYPVVLSFVNREQRAFMELCQRLAFTGSTRSDAIATAITAQELLSAFVGTNADTSRLKQTLNSQYLNGEFISLLPYSTGELKLSALIAACCKNALTKSTLDMLSESFYRHAGGKCTEEELVYSLLGLAACGEPILTDLEFVASGCEKFSDESKLVLAAAFAVIGDHGAAREIYSDIRDKLFTVTDNGTLGSFGTSSISTEDRIALTATALIPASVCAREDAELMKNYLLSHTSRTELYSMQLAFYLANYIAPASTESTIVYTVNGEKYTETLKAGRFMRLTLTKSELESFKVIQADGLSVYARYIASAEEAAGDNLRSDELEITKTVEPQGNGIYQITVSYKVVSDKDNVQFRITDTIPSGARFLRHGSTGTHSKNSSMWLSNSAQTMEGWLYCYNPSKGLSGLTSRTYTGSFSYFVRTAIPGEYVVEAAFAQNTDSGAYAISERDTITLK